MQTLDFITWTVNPNAIDSFITIRWYGLMFLFGFWVGYLILRRMYRREGVKESWVDKIFFWTVIATIVGARLGHVFFYQWDYYSQHLADIPKVWEGGLASHGGTIAIIIAVLLYSKFTTKRNPLWTFDRLVIPIALVGAMIRMGNLFNHEIYGHETTLPWGFRFITNIDAYMHGAEPIFTAPSHPTQIYEALAYLILFVLLMWMYWKKNAGERPGLIFGVFFTWLFSARFIIEFIKNDQVPFEAGMVLNMGQLLSIPFILIGIVLIAYSLKMPRQQIDYPDKFAKEDE